MKAAINKLYGSTTGSDNLLSKRFFDFDAPEQDSGLSERDATAAAKNGPPKRREYIANIVSDKFGCNGSYAVYVFLGNFDSSDPKCWPTQPNLVGTHAVFSMIPQDAKDDASKAKRAAMSGIQVTGTIPLNSALLERFKAGEMRSRQPGSVEEYMANNLQYRVARVSPTSSCRPNILTCTDHPLPVRRHRDPHRRRSKPGCQRRRRRRDARNQRRPVPQMDQFPGPTSRHRRHRR